MRSRVRPILALGALATIAALTAVVIQLRTVPVAHPLAHPIDPRFQTDLQFGRRSYWLQPWRAYLDTVPATRLLNSIGINFNVTPAEAPATARLLAAGFKRARIEISWGEFSYAHPDQLVDAVSQQTVLRSLRSAHIRPLILLNANAGLPCPSRGVPVTIVAAAAAGDRQIHLDQRTAGEVVPGHTGLNSFDQYKAAGILFTSVDKAGWATLSEPLPRALPAGTYPGTTLLYRPFATPLLSDGQPNPAFRQTLDGWLRYVSAVTRFVKLTLGDDQFDVEVWNEVTLGSDFLGINHYYQPAIDTGRGDVSQSILTSTVSWIRDPAHVLPDVGIGDGFSNQTPFPAGSISPPGLTALDKHPYPPDLSFPPGPSNPSVPLDALAHVDGRPDPVGNWHESFTPRFQAFSPEYLLTAIQSETLIRDLSPITTTIYGYPHGRFTHPPGSAAPAVWLTEDNVPVLNRLPRATPAVVRHIMTKGVLRILTSYVNKGASLVDLYAAKDGGNLNLINPAFFAAIDAARQPSAATAGETIAAVGRLVSALSPAQQSPQPRTLSLLGVADFANRIQFTGDGSRAHPPLYDRDVLAVFPFQVTSDRFVIPIYVMTRDMGHVYDPTVTGPARYDLPAEHFRLTLGGLHSDTARLTATDPVTGAPVPVEVHSRESGQLTVDMPVTDSPRLLVVDDGPAHS
ncbi:MAG: hypothetical protein M3Z27_02950 [Actinomycetota bacterium]|nr:hypothetical protein [Actinomycetota bacterium]